MKDSIHAMIARWRDGKTHGCGPLCQINYGGSNDLEAGYGFGNCGSWLISRIGDIG